jgi:hypothetical protein
MGGDLKLANGRVDRQMGVNGKGEEGRGKREEVRPSVHSVEDRKILIAEFRWARDIGSLALSPLSPLKSECLQL